MNCQAIQNKVLALPDPRRLPDELREHVEACAGCRAWWQQAAKLERLLERLPAPPAPADKKTAMIDDLTAAGPVIRTVPRLAEPAGLPGGDFLRRNSRYVAALAAAVLVVLGGWLLLKPNGQKGEVAAAPRHPLLEKLVQRDVALARATTSAQRLEILGGLADDLSGETRSLARVASPEDLDALARWFDGIVRKGIVDRAGSVAGLNTLTPAEKAELFTRLADKLAEAGREAEKVAGESPPHSQPALKKMADTAKDGQAKLRELARNAGA